MIKPKEGKCIDCAPDMPLKPLIAKRCCIGPFNHYKKHQQAKYAANAANKQKNKSITLRTANNGMTLGKWFNEQINQMPGSCENCDGYLSPYAPWSSRAYIAHILPKRNFISVMVHPLNRLFLCIDCHANFDNWSSKEVIKMKCWPVAVERFNSFKHLIPSEELSKLHPCFEDIY